MKELILKLKSETGCSMMDAKKTLESLDGNYAEAKKLMTEKALKKADKKADRELADGLVFCYMHGAKEGELFAKSGALLKLGCETDFVAKTDDFKSLAKDIAMHICAMNPETVAELNEQPFIKNPDKTITDFIKDSIAKLGENIKVVSFKRFSI